MATYLSRELLFISVNVSFSFPVGSIVEYDASFKEIFDAPFRVLFDVTLAIVLEVNVKGAELLKMLVTAKDRLAVCSVGES